MESLGYSLLSMYPGHELPWAHSEGSNTGEREEATLEMMMRTTLSGLCDGFPGECFSVGVNFSCLGLSLLFCVCLWHVHTCLYGLQLSLRHILDT